MSQVTSQEIVRLLAVGGFGDFGGDLGNSRGGNAERCLFSPKRSNRT